MLDEADGGQSHGDLASRLRDAANGLVFLGQFAMSHPDAAWLRTLAAYIADATGSALNVLPHGGNPAGAWLAGAVPHRGPGGSVSPAGMNVVQMLEHPRDCVLLWNFEPDYDIDNPSRAMATIAAAEKVIAVTSYATDSLRAVADVILPLAPLAESEGSLLNLDGDTMKFAPAGNASGDARPGWKILRRLGNELGLEGFDQVSLDQLQAEMNEAIEAGEVTRDSVSLERPVYGDGLYRIGELPMYSIDAQCRRSGALQETIQAHSQFVGLNPADAMRLGLNEGGRARVGQREHHVELDVRVSGEVPEGGAWVRSATCATRELEQAVAAVAVEVA
jgi:NADH-quinone oxidoreductase subunit G